MRIVSHAQKLIHSIFFSVAALTTLLGNAQLSATAQTKLDEGTYKTLLVNVDHRKQISLDGDWHTIVDPYGSGLYTFHNELRKDGYFLNEHKDNTEYDFSKSPTLKVPGDWNTQRELLHFYEGPGISATSPIRRSRTSVRFSTSARLTIAASSGSMANSPASTRAASPPTTATPLTCSTTAITSSSSL